MSSAGANQESAGGTFKNVIDNPDTKPTSHEYAEDPSKANAAHDQHKASGAGQSEHKPSGAADSHHADKH